MKRFLLLTLMMFGLSFGAGYSRLVFSVGGFHGDTLPDSVYVSRHEMTTAIGATAWDTLKFVMGWGMSDSFIGDTVVLFVDAVDLHDSFPTWQDMADSIAAGGGGGLDTAYRDTIQMARDTANAALVAGDSGIAAADSALTAADSALTAADSAITASDSALTASDSALTASDSAITAADSAITIADSALTASDSVLTAADSALAASDSALTVADSALNASDSALTAAGTALDTASAALAKDSVGKAGWAAASNHADTSDACTGNAATAGTADTTAGGAARATLAANATNAYNADSLGHYPPAHYAFVVYDTLTDADSIAWNLAIGSTAQVTLTANRVLRTPTNQVAGMNYTLLVIQDGAGARTLTPTTTYATPGDGAWVLTSTAGAVDILHFTSNGTTMFLTGGASDVK
jgi:hypothetical protein